MESPTSCYKFILQKYYANGQKYSYEAEVHNIQCKGWAAWRKCQSVDKVIVITSVDFRTNTSDGKQFGVTATYCKGRGDWCQILLKMLLIYEKFSIIFSGEFS